ncbi:LOW QUALITY PROTEIN: myosin-11-like [Scomber scombrus]|uniref:LOW QUALITY PROTEIN: myosin-11-like n=1 Tax=Scomber scombrus TaxID=13677 RepID=A0AAV1MXZ7_SCOSC
MSQRTTAPKSGDSEGSGGGSDTLNLSSPPGDIKPRVATQCFGIEKNSIKQLLNEFKGLYEQRLRCLESDTTIIREETLQRKVDFLQSYVNDLADQNQVLVQTIEDLQKEADHKVSHLGMKLRTSGRILDVPEVAWKTLSLDELVEPIPDIPHKPGSLVQIASELEELKIQLQTKDMVIRDLERELRENIQQKQKVLEGSERLVHLKSELSCLQRIQKDNMKEIAEKDIRITKLQANIELLQHEGVDTHAQLSKLNVRVRELQEEVRRKEEEWMQREAKQRLKYEKKLQEADDRRRQERQGRAEEEKRRDEELERALEEERKAHTQAIKKWAEKTSILNSELQTSEYMVNDISETLDQAKASVNVERQQRQQIQDQFQHANKEVERLQQELTYVRHTTEKKIQKREIKMCALVKELAESKKQHSDCQKKLLGRETALEKLCEERDELRAQMEDKSRECVHINQTKERLEADLALSHEKLHTSHLEVRSRDQLILQLRAEMKTAEQTHQGTQKQVVTLEGEVRRLNQKVRGHQEETCQLTEKVRDTERLKDQKEKDQQQLHDQLCISQQQIEASEEKLKKQEVELEFLHQQLRAAKEQLKEASLQADEQKETVATVKQKYTAAIEKVHKVQGRVELLEEELRYSQQQLKESQLASHSVKEELAELERRYHEKVGQWESSQEALDQLTDELQANQNQLRESQQNVDHFKSLMGTLHEQVDMLKQQKLMIECDLKLYQQSHSHSDEEYLSLLRHRQQLHKRCTEQVERLAECEKAILQMKSELERQNQEKAGLKQSLVASHHTLLTNRSQLEQEVTRLNKEVTRLELELVDTQKVHMTLLRQSEEELMEARQEAARRSRKVDVQKGEVQRLQKEIQKEEEKVMSSLREKQSLSSYIRQLSQELEDLRNKHQLTGSNQSIYPSVPYVIHLSVHLCSQQIAFHSTRYTYRVYTNSPIHQSNIRLFCLYLIVIVETL